ncbi:MAG TPA: hypothetical protein VGC99_02955, partial [Candidatus Tectomicrobia bacterium]
CRCYHEDRLALSNLTYKELLDLPAMGILSVLDFASTVEAAMDQLNVVGDLSPLPMQIENIELEGQLQDPPRPDLRDRLLKVIDASWASQISEQDPLDYRLELTATEQILVDVIRSSPTCVLDRSSYALQCIDRGMNQHTFSVYLTYSAVIAHVSTDIWTLRGLQVDPAAVEALRVANAEQPREKRVLDYGWTPEGRLWVGVRLPDLKSVSSFIFLMPSAMRRLVADGEFSAF